MAKKCQAFFKIAKDLRYISNKTEMIPKKEEVTNDLKWEMLDEDE